MGLLRLLLSDLNSNKSLGPVAAIGIAAAVVPALTFLPAMLMLLGRGAFWPFRPKPGTEGAETSGLRARVAQVVGKRPRLVGAGTAFSAPALLPMVTLVQMAFLVAFGVLLDTLIIRSLLVPALTLQIGRKIWWPSALSRGKP